MIDRPLGSWNSRNKEGGGEVSQVGAAGRWNSVGGDWSFAVVAWFA